MDVDVVYVHGIGNKPPSDILKRQWDEALFGADVGRASRMAYWASVLYEQPLVDGAPATEQALVTPFEAATMTPRRLEPVDTFVERTLREPTAGARRSELEAAVDDHVRAEATWMATWGRRMTYAADAIAAGEAGMGPSAIEAFPGPLVVRQAVFRALVQATLHDVYAYFFGGAGLDIRATLEEALRGTTRPVVLVAHSLGTVIAYDVLRAWGHGPLRMPLFLTLGSPLAVTEIHDVVAQPLEVPQHVEAGVNASDARDVVALDHTVRPEYAPGEKCTDYIVVNDSDNHHGIREYLRAPVVQQAVHEVVSAVRIITAVTPRPRSIVSTEARAQTDQGGTPRVKLKSVSKPESALEARGVARAAPPSTEGHPGTATAEASRSLRHFVVKGKSGPIRPPFEAVIGRDERVQILDTDLAPWRMICALRMRGPSGAGAIGTGWFIGPRTVLTAGHCVFSNYFFGGWASTIEVIPGLNGAGTSGEARPYGSVSSERFSAIDRWVEGEDADFDIGCIHLAEPLGNEVGWFAVGAPPPAQLESFLVNISGYPADRGGGAEQYHARNRVLRVSERRLFYEVDTHGGQSGAPVWIHEDQDAPPLAVGVHAYGTGATPTDLGITANSAPRIIPEVLDTLIQWLDQDGGLATG